MCGIVGSRLKMVKFEPTTPDMSQQQVALTGMLQSFGLG